MLAAVKTNVMMTPMMMPRRVSSLRILLDIGRATRAENSVEPPDGSRRCSLSFKETIKASWFDDLFIRRFFGTVQQVAEVFHVLDVVENVPQLVGDIMNGVNQIFGGCHLICQLRQEIVQKSCGRIFPMR